MSNVKIQMTKTTMNTQVLTFSHLDFIWHLSRLGGMIFGLNNIRKYFMTYHH